MVPTFLIGFDVIPQSAEEIDLPAQRIGLLLIVSVCCAVAWYTAVSLSVGFGMPQDARSGAHMATADAATAVWDSPWAGTLLVLGGIGGILTSWNAFIVGASRLMFALSRSGMLPAAFSQLHPRHGTPWLAIVVLGMISALAPLCGRTILLWLINTSSFAVLIAFIFVAIAFLALRRNEPELPRPFRVSFPRFVAYGAIVLCLGLLTAFMPWSDSALAAPEWGALGVWSVMGLVLAWRARD